MKLNKSLMAAFVATSALWSLTGCDNDLDYPPVEIPHATIEANTTIAEVKEAYWQDDRKVPDFARCVDIHRKCGYDPVELFLDPAIKFPKLKLGLKLARKKLGFRYLMDVIPLDASLVKGSHGRVPEDRADWPVLMGDFRHLPKSAPVRADQVCAHLMELCTQTA